MIIKEVKSFGNGAQIIMPKEWTGKLVSVSLKTKTIDDIKKEIINSIDDLSSVVSIILIGSYARNEQSLESDVDIVIFSTKKLELNLFGYDILFVNINKLEDEIKNNPVLFKSILQEGIVIMNPTILKYIKIDRNSIYTYKKNCLEVYNANKKLINLDKLDKNISTSVIYSIILRLKGLFILKNEKYSFSKFKQWLENQNIKKFNELYGIYKFIRDDKKINEIKYELIEEVEKINNLLFKYSK